MAIKVKKNLTDEEIKNIIEPELTKRLEEQRLVGVQIGWLACCKTVLKKIEEGLYQEAVQDWLKKEVEKFEQKVKKIYYETRWDYKVPTVNTKNNIKNKLKEDKISHVTLEVEYFNEKCNDEECKN